MNAESRSFKTGDKVVVVGEVTHVWRTHGGQEVLTISIPGYAGSTINVPIENTQRPIPLDGGGFVVFGGIWTPPSRG